MGSCLRAHSYVHDREIGGECMSRRKEKEALWDISGKVKKGLVCLLYRMFVIWCSVQTPVLYCQENPQFKSIDHFLF